MSDEFDKKMANAMVHIDAMSEATDIMHPKTAPTRWLLNLAPAFMLAAIGAGIAADRISVISYGKERPAVLGNNEAAWAQNRRAVTVVKAAN